MDTMREQRRSGTAASVSQDRLTILLGVVLSTCVAVGAAWSLSRRASFGPDFYTFWEAGRAGGGAAYHFDLAPGRPLPFVYPPTLLIFLTPLRLLGEIPAYLAWVAISTAIFVAAASLLARRIAPLALLATPVVFADATGQTSLLLGAALLAGLQMVSRPRLAGVLFALVIGVKPQLAFLLPIGLVFGGHWRALLWTVVAGIALAGLTTLAFGAHIWSDWLQGLQRYQTWQARVQPRTVSLAPHAGLFARAALVVGGGAIVALAFRAQRTDVRLIAVAGASMLAAPHAMGYDAAVLAPCAITMFRRPSALCLPAAALYLGWIASPPGLLAFVLGCGTPIASRLERLTIPGLDRWWRRAVV